MDFNTHFNKVTISQIFQSTLQVYIQLFLIFIRSTHLNWFKFLKFLNLRTVLFALCLFNRFLYIVSSFNGLFYFVNRLFSSNLSKFNAYLSELNFYLTKVLCFSNSILMRDCLFLLNTIFFILLEKVFAFSKFVNSEWFTFQ